MRDDSPPAEWTVRRVGDLFDMQLGKMLSKTASTGPNQLPYLTNRHVQWDRVILRSLDTMSFSRTEQQRYGLLPGDLLVCEGGEVGRTAMWRGESEAVFFQKAIHRLRASIADVAPAFVLRFMRFAAERGMLKDLTSQTSIAHLTQEKLATLAIPLPPLAEQRRIAEILDTVDEAIRKTEEVIAKLQQMKQGLLHDLLTRGINENGELRDPERHPEQFKDSALGLIPDSWQATSFGNLLIRSEYGISESLSDRGAIPVLRMMNLRDGEAELSDLKFSDSVAATKLRLEPGDILFNRTNSLEHVGRTGIWRGQITNASFASYLVRLVPNTAALHPEWLNRWLNWTSTQQRIRTWATPGVHQVNINPTNLGRTAIALPRSTEEQARCANVVAKHDAAITSEQAQLQKLGTLKQGLMNDLLTGRVRVPTEATTP